MEEQKLPTLLKKKSSYKIIITDDVEKKIRYLCHKIPNVEWSGVLFFTHEGSIETENLIITCVDIYLMDIGTGTYTEFDMSPDVISYMCDNPNLMDAQTGLIHSHNNMATFFSSTDLSTLQSEGNDRNHFVSLIVNNEGKYTAVITRKVKYIRTINESYSYGSFGDTEINGVGDHIEKSEFIEYFNLDIVNECAPISFDNIDKRCDEINKRKKSYMEANKFAVDRYNENPSIFPKQELRRMEDTGMRDVKSPDFPDISDEELESILVQMLTGSIIIKNPSSIDINKWVSNMPTVFGKRFGLDEKGFAAFRQWADSHCEFLIFGNVPDGLNGKEESDLVSNIAISIYEELEALQQNQYIKIFKEIIEQWIM